MQSRVSAAALATAVAFGAAAPAAAQPDSSWQVEEVVFEAADGVPLAGLVYVPAGDGPFPGAVLIQGSGSSDRTNLWARTFAETLAHAGVATLLPDKRGSGASGGDWMDASFEVLARDALAGVERLRQHAAVENDRVGLVGLSQGGLVAPLAATLGEVAWVVDVSGAAVTLAEQIRHEMANTARNAGLSPTGIAAVLEIQRRAERYVETGDWGPYAAARQAAAGEPWAEIAAGFPDTPDAPIWDWIRLNASYDPIPHWKAVDVPVLVVYGAEDEQDNLPVEASVQRLKQAFTESGSDDHAIRVFLDSGHALWAPDATQENLKLHPDLVALLDSWICGRLRLPSTPLPSTPLPDARVADARADLDGDGTPEELEIRADVELDGRGRPLWEDGHRWVVVVRDGPDEHRLVDEFVPQGTLSAWVVDPAERIPTIVVLRESGTSGVEVRAFRATGSGGYAAVGSLGAEGRISVRLEVD